MLLRQHIEWYEEDLRKAKTVADDDIKKALARARSIFCGGCTYCQNTARHKLVLGQTIQDMLDLVGSLSEGLRSSYTFPKTMYPEATLYRGFITDEGEYVVIHKTDHSQYRKEYATRHGEERAYRMINIHGHGMKTKVLFCDRKSPPSKEQYATLRELLIDAEGSLSFRFEFDTKHPA